MSELAVVLADQLECGQRVSSHDPDEVELPYALVWDVSAYG